MRKPDLVELMRKTYLVSGNGASNFVLLRHHGNQDLLCLFVRHEERHVLAQLLP